MIVSKKSNQLKEQEEGRVENIDGPFPFTSSTHPFILFLLLVSLTWNSQMVLYLQYVHIHLFSSDREWPLWVLKCIKFPYALLIYLCPVTPQFNDKIFPFFIPIFLLLYFCVNLNSCLSYLNHCNIIFFFKFFTLRVIYEALHFMNFTFFIFYDRTNTNCYVLRFLSAGNMIIVLLF